jgi:Asp-tRNA(Asn)/Glu-tRNA(Gln) amidotransferase A subunit family amidase
VSDLWRLSLTDALAQGAPAADVVASCRARIAALEPELHAWVHLADDAPVGSGDAFDGLPVGVKDVIDTADMPTEFGSAVHRGRRPSEDAACVALLRRAGATALGKTVTTELASFTPGPTRNPHGLSHTPGGSSSGSAAAVAAGMVPVALGTQTAGSVVRPATFCGIAGYAATHGELPMRGVQPLAPGLDTLGVFGREVADLALVRAALLGVAVARPAAPAAPRLVLWEAPELEPAMRSALRGAAAALVAAGAQVERPDLGAIVAELTALHELVMRFEVARTLVWEDDRRELLSDHLVGEIDAGLALGVEEVHAARERVVDLRAALDELLDGADAVVAAGAAGAAPAGLGSTGSPAQSRPWHVLGLPVVALPAGVDDAGMPLGIQLVGRRWCDDALLALGLWAEAVLPPAVRPWEISSA